MKEMNREMNREMELNMDELEQVNGGMDVCVLTGKCALVGVNPDDREDEPVCYVIFGVK